jgi:hypothetical protein
MGSAFAAGAGADMLQQILRQKFAEAMQQQELKEQMRQADMQQQIQQQQLGQGQQRIGLQSRGLDQDDAHFNARLGLDKDEFGFRRQVYDEGAPQRGATLAQTTAETNELLRRPAAEELSRDFTRGENVLDRQHGVRIAGINGVNSLRVAEVNNRPPAGPNGPNATQAYGAERNTRVLQSVNELQKKVSPWTTGAGSLLANIPATDARNFAAELNTLKSNIAFNELTEMRAASKTGGALGAVSDKETGLLESALGALDPGQSPANFAAQLEKIKGSLERWESAKSGGAPQGQGGTIRARDPQGNLHEAPAGTALPQGWKIEGGG